LEQIICASKTAFDTKTGLLNRLDKHIAKIEMKAIKQKKSL
jgi:hypothetical protein